MRLKFLMVSVLVLAACSKQQQTAKPIDLDTATDSMDSAHFNVLNAMTPALFDQNLVAEFKTQLSDLAPRGLVSGDIRRNLDLNSPCKMTAVGNNIQMSDLLFFVDQSGFRDGDLHVSYRLSKIDPDLKDESGNPIISTAKDEVSFTCTNDGSFMSFGEITQSLKGNLNFISLK